MRNFGRVKTPGCGRKMGSIFVTDLTPIFKVLVSQARVNSHLISILTTLSKHSNPGDDRDELIESLRAIMRDNQEFLDAMRAAVNKIDEEANG